MSSTAPGASVATNRELRLAVLLCLVGSGLLLLAAGRGWLTATEPAALPLPVRRVHLTGAELTVLRPLGVLGLAGVVALAATRGLGRAVVGALLVLAGAGAVATTLHPLGDPRVAAVQRQVFGSSLSTSGWPYVALVGGVLLALAGLLVAVRGRRWAALGARYEAAGASRERPPARPEVAAWEALDRGEDPTRT